MERERDASTGPPPAGSIAGSCEGHRRWGHLCVSDDVMLCDAPIRHTRAGHSGAGPVPEASTLSDVVGRAGALPERAGAEGARRVDAEQGARAGAQGSQTALADSMLCEIAMHERPHGWRDDAMQIPSICGERLQTRAGRGDAARGEATALSVATSHGDATQRWHAQGADVQAGTVQDGALHDDARLRGGRLQCGAVQALPTRLQAHAGAVQRDAMQVALREAAAVQAVGGDTAHDATARAGAMRAFLLLGDTMQAGAMQRDARLRAGPLQCSAVQARSAQLQAGVMQAERAATVRAGAMQMASAEAATSQAAGWDATRCTTEQAGAAQAILQPYDTKQVGAKQSGGTLRGDAVQAYSTMMQAGTMQDASTDMMPDGTIQTTSSATETMRADAVQARQPAMVRDGAMQMAPGGTVTVRALGCDATYDATERAGAMQAFLPPSDIMQCGAMQDGARPRDGELQCGAGQAYSTRLRAGAMQAARVGAMQAGAMQAVRAEAATLQAAGCDATRGATEQDGAAQTCLLHGDIKQDGTMQAGDTLQGDAMQAYPTMVQAGAMQAGRKGMLPAGAMQTATGATSTLRAVVVQAEQTIMERDGAMQVAQGEAAAIRAAGCDAEHVVAARTDAMQALSMSDDATEGIDELTAPVAPGQERPTPAPPAWREDAGAPGRGEGDGGGGPGDGAPHAAHARAPGWQTLSAVTWNSRALLCADPIRARAKWDVVTRMAADAHIVAVQELDGDHTEGSLATQRLRATHMGFHSVGVTPTAGGVAIWISHEWPDGGDVWCNSLVDGRILVVSAESKNYGRIGVAAVHNFEVPLQALAVLGAWIDHERRVRRATVCVLGDWNFEEAAHDDGGNHAWRLQHNSSRDLDERMRWQPVLRLCTEHAHGAPTRFGDGADSETKMMSSLDRMCTALPEYMMAHIRVSCRVGDPALATRGGGRPPRSDHVPVVTTCCADQRCRRIAGLSRHGLPAAQNSATA